MAEFEMKDFATSSNVAVNLGGTRIKEARDEVMDILAAIDKDKLSLPDLKLYVEILKVTSEVQVISFSEMWPTMYSALVESGFNSPKISDYKSE